MGDAINGEQRQHLGLSNRAYYVISSDMEAFGICDTKSGFINTILERYCDDSDATYFKCKERAGREFETLLKEAKYRNLHKRRNNLQGYEESDEALNQTERAIVNLFADAWAKQKVEQATDYPTETSYKARLRNDVYKKLYPEDEFDQAYGEGYDRVGLYLKAVLEDYASKGFLEREEIICKHVFEELKGICELPFELRPLLTLVYRGMDGSRQKFDVRPYKVMADTAGNYSYLACYSRKWGEEEKGFAMAPFRVSRVESIKKSKRASGKISKSDQDEIKKRIAECGVQYILGDNETFVVRLTPRGQVMFKSILHNRPLPKVPKKFSEDPVDLEFYAPRIQISNYFFTFGAEATILQPLDLAEEFSKRYLEASKSYGAYN